MPDLFRLPRVRASDPITDDKGRAVSAFVRFWDTFANRIERQEASQDALIAQILAAQAAADAAQATADAALAAAAEGNGARYLNIDGPPDTSLWEAEASNVPVDVKLDLSVTLQNGTLGADSSWVGTVTLYEDNGVSSLLVASGSVTITSTGDMLPGPAWQTSPSLVSLSGYGTYTGTVTYRVGYNKDSGADLVTDAQIFSTLTLTPKAA